MVVGTMCVAAENKTKIDENIPVKAFIILIKNLL